MWYSKSSTTLVHRHKSSIRICRPNQKCFSFYFLIAQHKQVHKYCAQNTQEASILAASLENRHNLIAVQIFAKTFKSKEQTKGKIKYEYLVKRQRSKNYNKITNSRFVDSRKMLSREGEGNVHSFVVVAASAWEGEREVR